MRPAAAAQAGDRRIADRGLPARLAKTAIAALGDKEAHEIELIWPGSRPPYVELFAWLEGRADKPTSQDPAPFRPAMLAHAIEDGDLAALDPADFFGNGNGTGSACSRRGSGGERRLSSRGLYHRTGEDISQASPISSAHCGCPARSTASC